MYVIVDEAKIYLNFQKKEISDSAYSYYSTTYKLCVQRTFATFKCFSKSMIHIANNNSPYLFFCCFFYGTFHWNNSLKTIR